jgi:acetolactate synthase-1/2/3 large subunit
MKISVGELIVRFMARLGIGKVFGMPGAHILPVYDRLYDSGIRTVLAKHEQGAAFMACGLARASGGIGACLATAGPGATNLVTGIANAYADRLPVLFVTGETSTHIFGRGGLQESTGEGGAIDQAALFQGITRYHKIVERTDYLGQVLNRTAKILLSANPGPVLLSIPYNVQNEPVDEDVLDGISYQPVRRCPPQPVAELAEAFAAAAAPVIVAGHGCLAAGAQAAVAELAHGYGVPVATSLKGKGIIAEDDPLALGCLGVTSDGAAFRYIAERADLLIILGAGFNERTSHVWNGRLLKGKRIVQVDHDPDQLEKVFKADLSILGDIDEVLTDLLATLHRSGVAAKAVPHLEGTADGGGAQRGKFPLMAAFFDMLASEFASGAMIFDDNIIFAQSFLRASPRLRYFPNSGISSLGHAIPAAIGARFAAGEPTFAVLGDGGFQMCGMELMAAVNYGIPLTVVLINNGSMGLIRKNQFQQYGERYIDCDFVNPDFALLARAFGIRHWRVAEEADVARVFAEADFTGSINLIEILLDKNAFPSYLSSR